MFSMASGLIDTAGDSITDLSVDMQNSELLTYEGAKVKGTEVRKLGRKIAQVQNNWAEDFVITLDGSSSDANGLMSVKSGHVFTVTMTAGNTGFIKTITVTDNAS